MNKFSILPEKNEVEVILQDIFFDPCFSIPEANGLDYPEARRDESLFDHLSYAVTQQPNNLHHHLRRIRLSAALGLPEMLAEAITDLFIVLGDKGGDLQERVLKSQENQLPEHWFSWLCRALRTGIDSHTPLPDRSRLTKGNTGRSDFVVPLQALEPEIPTREHDAQMLLETVRDLLNCGGLEEACLLLENELPKAGDALWEEGALELARLYRYMEGGEARARSWWAMLWRQRRERALAWAELLTQGAKQ